MKRRAVKREWQQRSVPNSTSTKIRNAKKRLWLKLEREIETLPCWDLYNGLFVSQEARDTALNEVLEILRGKKP